MFYNTFDECAAKLADGGGSVLDKVRGQRLVVEEGDHRQKD